MTWYIAREKGHFDLEDTLEVLGWWPVNVADIVRSFALVVLLFAGPLFEAGLAAGRWRDWITGRYLTETLASSVGWRNYIAVSLLSSVCITDRFNRAPSPKKSFSAPSLSVSTYSPESPAIASYSSHPSTLASHTYTTSTSIRSRIPIPRWCPHWLGLSFNSPIPQSSASMQPFYICGQAVCRPPSLHTASAIGWDCPGSGVVWKHRPQ